jgi:hypothetical protein
VGLKGNEMERVHFCKDCKHIKNGDYGTSFCKANRDPDTIDWVDGIVEGLSPKCGDIRTSDTCEKYEDKGYGE